jgi:phosphodiesterase/alkaline phosphatase D-like protein
MLGRRAAELVLDQVTSADQTRKVWGNETMVMQFKLLNYYLEDRTDLPEGGSVYVNLDQWDGY